MHARKVEKCCATRNMAIGGVACNQHGLMLTKKTSKQVERTLLCTRIERINKNAKLGQLQMHNSVTK